MALSSGTAHSAGIIITRKACRVQKSSVRIRTAYCSKGVGRRRDPCRQLPAWGGSTSTTEWMVDFKFEKFKTQTSILVYVRIHAYNRRHYHIDHLVCWNVGDKLALTRVEDPSFSLARSTVDAVSYETTRPL